MPFNPAVESPIPLTQVPLLSWLPKRRGRRKIHVSTIFRWACQGLHGQRLEAIRIGGTLCTSEKSLTRFFAALTAVDPLCVPSDPAPPRSPAASTRARRRAEKTLQAAGI
jgi:hypothetical protein